jgi:chloramphenicol 3-O-phosphotransferase
MAAKDQETIHRGLRYDLELDTSHDAVENAQRVLTAWRGPRGRSLFFN